jgi:hypothetical protein
MTGPDETGERRPRPDAPDSRDYRRAFGPTLTAGSHTEARALLAEHPDHVVVLRRGRPRAVLFRCPDNCGDLVVVNVDPDAGRAWRLREGENGDVTLMPSVWRSTGCHAHFIVWRSRISWCRFVDDLEVDDAGGDESHADDQWVAEMDAELRDEWRRIRTEWSRRR